MTLYLVERIDEVGYDQYEKAIVRAANPGRAKQVFREDLMSGYKGDFYANVPLKANAIGFTKHNPLKTRYEAVIMKNYKWA